MGKPCAICGKNGYMYFPLCKEHLDMKNEGKVQKCEQCSSWYLSENGCPNCKLKKDTSHDIQEATSTELTCIICGEDSNGYHFCRSCYAKYKDRAVDIRITHCSETEILDEYGNLTIKCDDGRKVRSRAEAMISNWLYKEKIRSVYEKPEYYIENGESKTLHPDFYLPDYKLYIEYNELTNKPYLKSKEYTKSVYKSLGLNVFIMTEKDLQDIEACLKPLLMQMAASNNAN